MKKLKFILCLCLPILVTSCLSEGYNTIILPADESAQVEKTTIDEETIPLSIQQKLELYMPINEGSKPPIINGVYLISPFEAVYTSDGTYLPGRVIDDYEIMFSGQSSGRQSLIYDGAHIGLDSYESSDDVLIIGKSNNFTAYFISTGATEGINYKTATLISGTVSSTGIKDFYYAIVMLEKGYDAENNLMDVNGYRIYKDGDGLASNSTWKSSSIIDRQQVLSGLIAEKK